MSKKTKNLFIEKDKNDGWYNLMTGAGVIGQDKRVSTTYELSTILTHQQLIEMYRGDGMAKRIVDVPVNDMTRTWFHVEGDPDNTIVKALDEIGLRKAIKDAKRWARLFGGSLLVMGINDGSRRTGKKGASSFESPLNEDNIKKLSFFRVYTNQQVSWDTTDIDDDYRSENFGKPKLFTVTPNLENTSIQYKVHYTRVIRFIGEPLPEETAGEVRWWGDSALQGVFTRLRGFANSLVATETIVDEFTMGVMTIKNLQDLIAAGQEELITKRLQQIDMAKHILNTVLVDEEEDFKRITAQVNGIKDILEFFKDCLSAVSGIPQIKLFGEQSKGLGSQAAGNIRLYYDDISDKQEDELRPPLDRVISLLLKSKEFKGKVKLDDWQIVFNELWQMADSEIAVARHLQAKADGEYIKTGTVSPEEVAKSRFGGETYSFDTQLLPEGDKFRKKMEKKLTSDKPKTIPGKDNNGEPKDSNAGGAEPAKS